MATPTIEAISTQDITIDTDYELEIGITGDPEEVTVERAFGGVLLLLGCFDNDVLTIAGEATRLLGDAIWTITREGNGSTAVTIVRLRIMWCWARRLLMEIGDQTIIKVYCLVWI